ncbi:MAG: hypothetical protein LBC12_05500 [Nitrososphaerota archaeon]|nr:hypothetical protein [Nitrososphaerota archaeon]
MQTLTNSVATHINVYQYIIWLCASYVIVDIYFIGHGFQGSSNFYGYCCYDGVNSNGSFNYNNFFYAPELKSYYIHNYSFATLRLGVGSFRYSGAFKDYFLGEGAVWIGGKFSNGGAIPAGTPLQVLSDYALGYITTWGNYWYIQNVGSYNAHNYAHTAGDLNAGFSMGGNPQSFDHYTKPPRFLSIYP